MLKYQNLVITHPEEELVALLQRMKAADKGAFLYQKKLAAEYADSLFVLENHVGCFKTRRASLAESSVWVVITGSELKLTNITPSTVSSLGITEYNIVLNAFFHDFVAKFIDATWEGSIFITGERVSLSDLLSDETYNALMAWESACNKSAPTSHPSDRERWISFVSLAHRDAAELNAADFGQWLTEDMHWPPAYNEQIYELEVKLEYSFDLLNHYDGINI